MIIRTLLLSLLLNGFWVLADTNDFILGHPQNSSVELKRALVLVPDARPYTNIEQTSSLDTDRGSGKQSVAALTNHNSKPFFNHNERAYLRSHPILRVGVEHLPPIIYSSDGLIIKGIVGDYIQRIAEISGVKVEVVLGSSLELQQLFKQHKIDLLPTAYLTVETKPLGLFGTGYLKLTSGIYTQQNNLSITDLAELNGRTLAVPAGHIFANDIRKMYPKIKLVNTINAKQSLDMLFKGDVDAVFEIDAVMSLYLHKQQIETVKSNQLTHLPSKSLLFLTQSEHPILQSILNKSLVSINDPDREKTMRLWLNNDLAKTSVNIALGFGREPYTLSQQYVRGIEYDLAKRVLNLSGIDTNSIIKLPVNQLSSALDNNRDLDMVITVKKQHDNYFYSDDFTTFNNVAISRLEDKLAIFNINDLVGLNIMAFDSASDHLGPEFAALFGEKNRPLTYSEGNNLDFSYQQPQIEAIIAGAADVIILDLNIFKWYIKQTGYHAIDQFNVHTIFPETNKFQIAFRDKPLRDVFNFNLNKLKINGQFDYVIADYADGHATEKAKFTALFSAISAKLLFDHNNDALSSFANLVATLSYINKIEIYDTSQQLMHSTSHNEYKFYNELDSFHYLSGINIPVGRVRIYFNDQEVKHHLTTSDLIPKLGFFKNNSPYEYISTVYRRFNLLDAKNSFSAAEQAYLQSNPVLSYSDIDWRPLSIVKNGAHSGLTHDYMNLISKLTGIKFDFIENELWSDALYLFNSKQVDMLLSSESLTEQLFDTIASDEYANFKLTIVMKENAPFVASINDLKDKTLVLPKGFTAHSYIKSLETKFNIITTDTVFEALTLVSEGKADAFIGHFAVVIYQLERYFSQLSIVGLVEREYSHRLLLHKSNRLAMSIINKAIRTITQQQHQNIRDRWIKTKVSTAVDYRLIYQIIGLFIVILILVSLAAKRLSLAKNQVEQANKGMLETVTALEEQKHIFETLFYDASDGLLLMIQDMFIDCNNSAIEMLGLQSKSALLNGHFLDFSPSLQPNGQPSRQQFLEIENYLEQHQHHQFEWVFTRPTGQSIWVEIILTTITLNNQDVVHVVWRDISDKKTLEGQILKRNNELESKNSELNQVIDELNLAQDKLVASEKMASLGGLVAGIAHEVNTPVGIGLTASSLFIDLTNELEKKYLAKTMSNQYFSDYLKSALEAANLIYRNLDRTAELVQSFKQISVDQSSDERRSFNVLKYINGILLSTHHIMKNSNLNISVICCDRLVIDSYPGAFSQILSNFLINSSIHAYPQHQAGAIIIKLKNNNGAITLSYQDDGRGISPEHLKRIFEPFFTTNRDFGGSGLGLNIIYNIVSNRLNGKIECHSTVGFGTEFVISFQAEIKSQ